MNFTTLSLTLVICFLATKSRAVIDSQIYDPISFKDPGDLPGGSVSLPYWHLLGDNFLPSVHSDRIILTPPYPGNVRSALWSKFHNQRMTWDFQVNFRASGSPDNGHGGLYLWYVTDGLMDVKTSSIYSVKNFTGVVISITPADHHGGVVRGFWNDGSVDFQQISLNTRQIGQCHFSYRNLGVFTELNVKYHDQVIDVLMNNALCFKTPKITFPNHFRFGITADSGSVPDSLEISRVTLKSLDDISSGNQLSESISGTAPNLISSNVPNSITSDSVISSLVVNNAQNALTSNSVTGTVSMTTTLTTTATITAESPPDNHTGDSWWSRNRDGPASEFHDDASRFRDVHERLYVLNHQMNTVYDSVEAIRQHQEHLVLNVYHQLDAINEKMAQQHQQLQTRSEELNNLGSSTARLAVMERSLREIEARLEKLDNSRILDLLRRVDDRVSEHYSTLHAMPIQFRDAVKKSTPRLDLVLLSALTFIQISLLIGYISYKRYSKRGPKKYL